MKRKYCVTCERFVDDAEQECLKCQGSLTYRDEDAPTSDDRPVYDLTKGTVFISTKNGKEVSEPVDTSVPVKKTYKRKPKSK